MTFYIAYLKADYGAREEENLFYSHLVEASNKQDAKKKLQKFLEANKSSTTISEYAFREFQVIR